MDEDALILYKNVLSELQDLIHEAKELKDNPEMPLSYSIFERQQNIANLIMEFIKPLALKN